MERKFREKGARFNGVLPVMKEDPDVIVIKIRIVFKTFGKAMES